MNLRPKTKRRLAALTAGGVIFGAAASVIIYIQLNREENRENELRLDGLGAYQRGEYAIAVDDFKKYSGNGQLDAEATFAYAVSRSKVPLPAMAHLREAKSLFTRYLELKPGDTEAQHQLLSVYSRLRYSAEASALSDTLLAKNPDDVPALTTKMSVYAEQSKYTDALKISERINDLDPTNLRAQETTYDLMVHCRRPPEELTARADRMLGEHAGDPRFQLLRADAAAFTGDLEGARRYLRLAAASNALDPQTMQMLAGAMDRIGMWNDARTLIERSATSATAPPTVTAAWVLRLWESGQVDQALTNLKSVIPDTHADARLLGLKALILFSRQSADAPDADAAAALKDLDARQGDVDAACWSALLHSQFVEGLNDPRQAVIFGETACHQDPDNPVARFDQAMAYLRLGESELALKCLWQTTELAPGWSSPYVVIARTLLERGQVVDALAPAQAAFDRDPASSAAQTTLVITETAQQSPTDLDRLLVFARQVRTSNPDDPKVTAAYIDLLARTGHRDDATSLLVSTIANSAIKAGALCDLMAVNNANHLDLNDAINDRAAHHTPGTPTGMYDQIRLFIGSGRIIDARRVLHIGTSHDTPDWKLAVLQSQELFKTANLAPAWAEVADANPDDLTIQRAVLKSRVAWTDRALIDRTITRCKTLTTDDSVQWRLARAHWQLQATDNVKNNAVAVAAAMEDVVKLVPQMLEPHLVWADAMERLGDLNGAVAQLRAARTIAPTPDVTVELARVLASAGQYSDAVGLVESVSANPALSTESRGKAVRILRQSGEARKASDLLENSPGDHSVEQDLQLARLYSELGDDVSASHLYTQLMQVPKPSNPVLRDFAWFQASRGNFVDAHETLKRLDTDVAGPGEIQLINADFEATFGTSQSAAAAYRAATAEAPTNPQTWLALAGFDLRGRDFYGAATAADQGLKYTAGDAPLTAMAARARTLATLSPAMDVQPLIESLASDPANPSGVAALTALATSHAAKATPQQSLASLTTVAQANPRYLPVQLMLASRDSDAGLNDDAVQVASRAMTAFPTAAEPARLLARINYSTGHWSDALSAATEWRKRTLAHPQPADNAVASDQEQLGHPELALEILAPFLPRSLPAVQASPNVSSDDSMTVFLDARALALQHNYAQVQIMLAPLCSQSGNWRRQCLKIIADTAPDAATAISQMSKVEAAIPAGSIDDRVALADARYTVGARLNDEGLLQRSLDGLQALTDAGSAPVDAWVLLGAVDQALNQPAEAEKAYRKALSISPVMPLASNNLAALILQRNGDLREARVLAEQAVAAQPGDSTLNTTLGQVEAQAGDLDAAQVQLENAVRLDPQNTSALVSLAEVQCRAAKPEKAIVTVQRVDDIVQMTHKPLIPAVRQQLDKVREACKTPSGVG